MGTRLNDARNGNRGTTRRLVRTSRMRSIHLSLRWSPIHERTFTGGRLRSTTASALSVTRSYFIPNSFFWKYFCACVRIWMSVRVGTYSDKTRSKDTMVEIFLQSFPNFSSPLRNKLCSCIVHRPMLLPPSPCCGYTGAPSASPS